MTEKAREKRDPSASRAYGIGFAYRFMLHEELMKRRDRWDFLEMPVDDYIEEGRKAIVDPYSVRLRDIVEQKVPTVVHGVSLSIGTAEPPDADYLRRVDGFVDECRGTAYSEHLSFCRAGEKDVGHFIPLPLNRRSVEEIAANYAIVRSSVKVPVLLENVTYLFPIPGNEMTEPEFIRAVLERCDAGLVLDVANAFINGYNHRYDPYALIAALPAERVVQVHMAGGNFENGFLFDSHGYYPQEEVWKLLDFTIEKTGAEAIIFERDKNFNPVERLFEELDRARAIFDKHRPKAPAPRLIPDGIRATGPVAAKPRDPELKRFQEILVRIVTDPDFRARFDADPDRALAPFDLTAAERSRLTDIDKRTRHYLITGIYGKARYFEEDRVQQKQAIWDAWARLEEEFKLGKF